jgi:hypothetical protein
MNKQAIISLLLLGCSLDLQAGFLDAFSKNKTESEETTPAEKLDYTPQAYAFEIPVEEVPQHDMKIIYSDVELIVEGDSAGLEKQINSFKTALNDGFKNIIKSKKFTIYHELSGPDYQSLTNKTGLEALKAFTQLQEKQDIDEVLKSVPYVKKKKSAALITSKMYISLKYDLKDSSNLLKSALIGNKIKKGSLYFSGKVDVEYLEPMTKEVLIQQSFDLKSGSAPVEISYNDQSGMLTWKDNGSGSAVQIYSSTHVMALDKILHESYSDVMKKYFEYLSAEELADLKDIITELKGKKNY